VNRIREVFFVASFAVGCVGVEWLAIGCTGHDTSLNAAEGQETSIPKGASDGGDASNSDTNDSGNSDSGDSGNSDTNDSGDDTGPKSYDVSTLAGNGDVGAIDSPDPLEATFNKPWGIAIGPDGSLYVSDSGNHKIRKIDGNGVSTYAGTGTENFINGTCKDVATFAQPGGIAFDANGNLYVADISNSVIRKIIPEPDCKVTTLAGAGPNNLRSVDGTGTLASFYNPEGLAVDANGNVYVTDFNGHKIRKVDSNGKVTTIAGTGAPGNTNDDQALEATFNFPRAIAIDQTGILYVTEQMTNDIRKITTAGQVTTLAGSGAAGPVIDGTGADAVFNDPIGIMIDARGNLLVADPDNHAVRQVTPDGVVTTIAGKREPYTNLGKSGDDDGPTDVATFNQPIGVAVGPGSVIYVADYGNNTIRKLTPVWQ
jgi:sugar lactone lactonase YvrE